MLRSWRLSWLFGACLALGALAVRPVEAADGKPRESARTYYDKATSAFGLGNYDQAAELYEKAFQLRADPALLYDAAQAHRMAGHKERALELYRNYTRLFPDAKQVPDARRHMDELQAPAAGVPPPTVAPLAPAAPGAPSMSNQLLTLPPPPPGAAATAPGGDLTKTASPSDATAPNGQKRSRTWIWIALGGAVVAGAITTAVLLGGSTRDPTPTLGAVGGGASTP